MRSLGDEPGCVTARITTDGGAFVGDPVGEMRAAGVVVSGDEAVVENTRTGIIESKNAASAAVELNVLERDGFPTADLSSSLENFGLIKGAGVAVLGGAGEETVVNHGHIVGDVDLGRRRGHIRIRQGRHAGRRSLSRRRR
jgi:hypothetical protein